MKAHGIRGEVIVDLVTNHPERVDPGTMLETDRGPLKVLHSSLHQGRYIVAFDGILDRNQAEQLRGEILRAEPLDAGDELWIHELIGSAVVDTAGRPLGTVQSVEANPASDLLVLDGGGLVPLRFVVDRQAGKVTVDPPEGLLDQ